MSAIISRAVWTGYTGITPTSEDATSVDSFCVAVDRALRNLIKPYQPTPLTVSNCVLDAPNSPYLQLPILPARSITSVYFRADAYGSTAAFTSAYLIDNSDADEYVLEIDDKFNSHSRQGRLRRIGGNWTNYARRQNDRLSRERYPLEGAILVNYAAGALSVPADLEAAAVMAVTLLYERRKTGMPVQSESWNGYSRSLAGPFTAEGAVRTPDVLALLYAGGYLAVGVA